MNTQTQSAPIQSRTVNAQAEWITIHTATDAETGITVEVQKLAVPGGPIRWSLSGTGKNGPTRSVNPNIRIENGEATCVMPGMRVARMIDEAILIAKDEKLRSGGGPKRQSGASPLGAGMTPEKREAKKRRHEANLVARRAADAERTSKTKGKG